MKPGPKNLITDVEGFLVGNAEDHALKSGVTVFTSNTPFAASYNVMGGAPGTRETDLLEADKMVEAVDALVLSGGSAFGLEAASGVAGELRKQNRGYAVGNLHVPVVPAAIIFDLLNGGKKDWQENPYAALGAKAFSRAAPDFMIGTAGAGTGALTGFHKGGLGSASYVLASGITIGALVAVNALGSVTTPGDQHLWAAPFEENKEFGGRGSDPRSALAPLPQTRKTEGLHPNTNTTIAIVATDADLNKAALKRLATAAHDGIARAIVPAHTPFDGDLVFAASSAKTTIENDPFALVEICHAAALCLTRAIGRAVYHAKPSAEDLFACWNTE